MRGLPGGTREMKVRARPSATFLARSFRYLQDNVRKSGPAAAASYTIIGAILLLGGIGSTADNLAAAFGGESFEVDEMYPAYHGIAKLQGNNQLLDAELVLPHLLAAYDNAPACAVADDAKVGEANVLEVTVLGLPGVVPASDAVATFATWSRKVSMPLCPAPDAAW